MRAKVRKHFPHRPELVRGEDQALDGHDRATASGPIARAEQILRDIGEPGFRSEEDILLDFVTDMCG